MRRWIAGIALLTLWSSAALAAPICQNRDGQPVHCDAKTAMPLGWTLPDSERAAHPLGLPADPHLVADAVLMVVLLLIMIALLPKFDGRSDEDWDGGETE